MPFDYESYKQSKESEQSGFDYESYKAEKSLRSQFATSNLDPSATAPASSTAAAIQPIRTIPEASIGKPPMPEPATLEQGYNPSWENMLRRVLGGLEQHFRPIVETLPHPGVTLPKRNMEPIPGEELARAKQSLLQNLSEGAIGFSPYLNPGGPALFASDIARNPGVIGDLLKMTGGAVARTATAPFSEQSREELRQQPVETLAGLLPLLGAGLGVKKGIGKIKGLEKVATAEAPLETISKPVQDVGKPAQVPTDALAQLMSIVEKRPEIPGKKGQTEPFGKMMKRGTKPEVAPVSEAKPVTSLPEGKQVKEPTLKESSPVVVPLKETPPTLSEPPVVEPPKPPVEKKPIVPSGEPVGLKNAETERLREAWGLGKRPKVEQEKWEASQKRAQEAGLPDKAIEIADEVIATKRPLGRDEYNGLAIKMVELQKEAEASWAKASELAEQGNTAAHKLEMDRLSYLEKQVDKIVNASEYAGATQSRDFNIRKVMLGNDYSFAKLVQKAQAISGKKLSLEQKSKFAEMAERIKQAEAKVTEAEKKAADYQVQLEKTKAEKALQREARKATISRKAAGSKEKILSEREDIKKQLRDIGFRVNDITGVTAEGSYLIGKLALNYAKEGAVSMNEVVRKVMVDIPDITEADVWQSILAKDPKRAGKARSEASKQVALFRRQAKLLTELSDEKALSKSLLNELTDVAYKTAATDKRLENILRTINDLRAGLKGEVDPASINKKIGDLKRFMSTANKVADLENQLRTGEFKIKPKPEPKPISPELERAKIDLKVAQRRVHQALAAQERLKPIQEIIATSRTMLTIADISAVGRQGAVLIAAHPTKAPKAFTQALQGMFSKYKFEQIDTGLRNRPTYHLGEKAKLDLTDVSFGKREEFFASNLIERIPGLRDVVGASNRHMTTFLNVMRAGAFDDFVAKYPNATSAELQAVARWINVATGRGDWGAPAYGVLSKVFFAPRFTASRIQTPFMVFAKMNSPRTRKMIAWDMFKFASTTAGLLELAHLGGLDVGTNPRNADWGKIKDGKMTFDLFAGMQQPARVIARIFVGLTDKAGISGKDYREIEREIDPKEMLMMFSQYRLAPYITTGNELWTGKTMMGDKVTPGETAIRSVLPLVFHDMYEAYQEENKSLGKGALALGLSGLGVGVNTYDSKREIPYPGEPGRKEFLEKRLAEIKVRLNPYEKNTGNLKKSQLTPEERADFLKKKKEIEDILKRGGQ